MGENYNLQKILRQLEELQIKLNKIKDISGAGDRIEKMKSEIHSYGWNGIIKKYHPDINLDEPEAMDLFLMYKAVYTQMIENGEIKN